MSNKDNVSLNSIDLPLFITKVKIIQAKLIDVDYMEINNLSGETLIGVKGDWLITSEDGDVYIKDKYSFMSMYEALNNSAKESIAKLKKFEKEKKNNSILLAYYGELRDILKDNTSIDVYTEDTNVVDTPINNKQEGDI